MARQTVVINSIFGGLGASQYFSGEGQFLDSIGVDPHLPISDAVGDRKTSGAIRWTAYEAFDGANVNANPYWIVTNPKDAKVYTILNNGRIVSYNSSLASETLEGTASSSSGNGAAYYNNYLYVATDTDVSRFGPLDGSPSLTNSFWTSTLSLTALVNTTYPNVRGSGVYPNHPMHVHVDNKLYIGDFKDGEGLVHFIKTSKTTDEGDTNDGSTYEALDLPFGYMPIAMESLGNDLVIAAIQTSDEVLKQGKAALFFWNTVEDSFYNIVDLPDPLVTALKNVNGNLYVFSGGITDDTDESNGYRVSVYAGGQTVQTIYYSETGSPPLPGAVDAVGDRLTWGTFTHINTTTASAPTYYAVAMALGSKNPGVPSGIHCIAKATASASSADGLVTALKYVEQESFSKPLPILGWRDAANHGIDKRSTTYGTVVWRSQIFNIGQKFTVRRIRMPLGAAVAANMTITPKIFVDDFSSSSTDGLTVVNNTNYAASERHVELLPSISGNHNFCLELVASGTANLPVEMPIIIEFDTESD